RTLYIAELREPGYLCVELFSSKSTALSSQSRRSEVLSTEKHTTTILSAFLVCDSTDINALSNSVRLFLVAMTAYILIRFVPRLLLSVLFRCRRHTSCMRTNICRCRASSILLQIHDEAIRHLFHH